MKKLFTIAVLMALAMSGFAQEVHFDFSVINSTGYAIYYRIVDEENHQVEATYPCQNGDNFWWGYDKPEGKLILADTITYQGTDYTLVAIGDHAFCGCSGLRGSLALPQTITAIGEGAFKGCVYLNGDLIIPNLVNRIENEAFCDCSGLSGTLTLSDSLTFIGAKAFYRCSGLSGVLSIPNEVSEIGDNAFEQCTGFNDMVILPKTLELIGEQAFKGDANILFFSVKCQTPPVTAANAFDDIPTEIPIYVPYNAKEAYQNTSGWSRFGERIVEKSLWNGSAMPWTEGSGTEDDPYLIESAENLAWLATKVNERFNSLNDVKVFQDTCFKLVIDLDLQRNTLTWTSIGGVLELEEGDRRTFFSGVFDGNDHTISSYYLSNLLNSSNVGPDGIDSEGIDVGLFASVSDAVISNINVANSRIHSNRLGDRCGGIAGKAVHSVFFNCHFAGTITSDQNSPLWTSEYAAFGGIVGEAQSCRIEKCTSDIDLFGFENTLGGIVGVLLCDDSIGATDVLDCSTTGTIKLWQFNTYEKAYAGGVVGRCGNADGKHGKIQIEHCYNKALIKGLGVTDAIGHVTPPRNQIVGGVAGASFADTLSILNCYGNHDIDIHETNASNYSGGIIGSVASGSAIYVKNCYHIGDMIAYHRGGVLAQIGNMNVIRNCYFDQAVAPDDGFGIPLDNDYMKTAAFVNQLNNGSTVFMMDHEPYVNDGFPVFGTDGLIFVGAEWYYEILNDDGSITYQHLQCTGDTIMANKRPKIIVRSNTHYDRGENTEMTNEYVYEENGVVYWWNKELQTFTMLYDFSAEEGDEWEILVGSESITTKVYEVENYMIDGIPYKKMTIGDDNNLFSGTLISTIGHLISFFPEKLMSRGKGYQVDGLRCYWLDGGLLLKLGDRDCDEVYEQLHHGIDEPGENGPATGSGTFTVYPNPTNGVLFVETRHGTSLPDQTAYRITNLTGQTLLQGNITAKTQQINIESLPDGMYFIIFAGEKTVKFVVQ
ncbi:MAG: leucine-rich repeat domain-containing protein [Bacteroidales bacterium]|nr:leucine-rich repeat domain-containing protein [Bacteroidales bacterium]